MKFQAYLFDMQGTLFDFFTPVKAAVAAYATEHGLLTDSAEFTREWRADYFRRVSTISTTTSWTPVQSLYAEGFSDVCAKFGFAPPTTIDARVVAQSWQQLIPWLDVPAGIATIRDSALTATLSNTDMATIVNLCRQTNIQFDAYFTAELFGRFKPDPTVYLTALRYLGVQPGDAALVASHLYDLRAAAKLGMGTVFIERPLEFGEGGTVERPTEGEFNQSVTAISEIG